MFFTEVNDTLIVDLKHHFDKSTKKRIDNVYQFDKPLILQIINSLNEFLPEFLPELLSRILLTNNPRECLFALCVTRTWQTRHNSAHNRVLQRTRHKHLMSTHSVSAPWRSMTQLCAALRPYSGTGMTPFPWIWAQFPYRLSVIDLLKQMNCVQCPVATARRLGTRWVHLFK